VGITAYLNRRHPAPDDELFAMLQRLGEREGLEALAEQLFTGPGLRSWSRVAATDDADAWLIAWGAGSEVAAHDHGGSRGAVRVLRGALTEASRDRPTGRWHRRSIRSGQSIEVPTTAVHRVSNLGPAPALSLHVYSPPLATMNFVAASSVASASRAEVSA
jgi:mannose-6-phosphate isomerase-like protein (cupin superfamily)